MKKAFVEESLQESAIPAGVQRGIEYRSPLASAIPMTNRRTGNRSGSNTVDPEKMFDLRGCIVLSEMVREVTSRLTTGAVSSTFNTSTV